MAALVELHEGDVLVVRLSSNEPPIEAEIDALSILREQLGLASIVFLGPEENVNIFHPDDDTLAVMGLLRCEHESAHGEDQSEGPDKVWVCDMCGWRYVNVPDDGDAARDTGLPILKSVPAPPR